MRIDSTAGRLRWAEYAMEAGGLALFMVAAVAITAAIEHPGSPVRHAVGFPLARRALTGTGMAVTAAALIYSPWGRRSGAHLNPSVTLAYWRLGKLSGQDAAGYVLAQFLGAAAGVALCAAAIGDVAADAAVNFVATTPGVAGIAGAFAGELVISFGMMSAVLAVSNRPPIARFTGLAAASLVALYITLEAPISGMSMNPARSFAPAIAASAARSLWIYFVAPPIGMLLAAQLYVRRHGLAAVRCAKLHHPRHGVCHFNCRNV